MKNNKKNKVNSLKINERKISDRYFFNILPFECLEKEIVFYYSTEKIKCFKVNSQFRYCKEDILNFLNTK